LASRPSVARRRGPSSPSGFPASIAATGTARTPARGSRRIRRNGGPRCRRGIPGRALQARLQFRLTIRTRPVPGSRCPRRVRTGSVANVPQPWSGERRKGETMIGVIHRRDILAHPFVTVQSFGWNILWRSLLAASGATFLSLLVPRDPATPEARDAVRILASGAKLELRVRRLYVAMAQRHASPPRSSTITTFCRFARIWPRARAGVRLTLSGSRTCCPSST
jgi:hypothetical protein